MKRLLVVILGWGLLAVSALINAQASEQWQEAWGPYAHAAGRTAVSDSGNTRARWYWIEPGKSLMQEYRRASDDVVFRETLITLGSEPGTLVVAGRPVGMAPEPAYVAVIQPDGRLFLPRDAGTQDTGNVLEVTDGGGLAFSPARVDAGRVVPNAADDRKYLRFALDPAPPGDPDIAVAAVVASEPEPALADAVPVLSAVSPGMSSPAAGSSRQAWGVLATLVGHDWLRVTPSGRSSPESFAWKVPGESIVRTTPEDETVYTLAPDGTIPYVTIPERTRELRREHKFYVIEEGTLVRRAGFELNARTAFRLQPNGQIVEWEHFSFDPEFPTMMSAYLRADGSTGREIQLQNGNALRNPAAWGPFAALANARIDYAFGATMAPVVSDDGNAMHFVRVPDVGYGSAYPEYTVRLGRNGTFVMREFGIKTNGAEVGYLREARLEGASLVWRTPGSAAVQARWRMDIDDQGDPLWRTNLGGESSEWWDSHVSPTFYRPGLVDEALARLEKYDRNIEGQVASERTERIENSGPYNRFAVVANTVLDAGMAVYEATVPPPDYASTATVPAGPANAGQGDVQAKAQDAPVAAAKPLRFVLTIGMRNLPGDTHNPTCYSNVITRPGPPGWGAPGFLPSGSAEQALREIDALKSAFIAACERSGRAITSEANFTHVRNQDEGDEERMRATQPRFAEDVAVQLD